MIEHLQKKRSKVTNKDKLQLKKDIFIMQILLTYFKQIENARKQRAKWNEKVSDGDIVIHVVDQIYEWDWFCKETMVAWGETQKKEKTLIHWL